MNRGDLVKIIELLKQSGNNSTLEYLVDSIRQTAGPVHLERYHSTMKIIIDYFLILDRNIEAAKSVSETCPPVSGVYAILMCLQCIEIAVQLAHQPSQVNMTVMNSTRRFPLAATEFKPSVESVVKCPAMFAPVIACLKYYCRDDSSLWQSLSKREVLNQVNELGAKLKSIVSSSSSRADRRMNEQEEEEGNFFSQRHQISSGSANTTRNVTLVATSGERTAVLNNPNYTMDLHMLYACYLDGVDNHTEVIGHQLIDLDCEFNCFTPYILLRSIHDFFFFINNKHRLWRKYRECFL